jgi:hypothetical protein
MEVETELPREIGGANANALIHYRVCAMLERSVFSHGSHSHPLF